MSKPFYITTTLPYVNAAPHIGFAFELVSADIIARHKRLSGYEVFFNTGTDEHGVKVFRKAKEEGKDPQTYVDEYAKKYRALLSAPLMRRTKRRRRNCGNALLTRAISIKKSTG